MRISDWSSDVCSSDLESFAAEGKVPADFALVARGIIMLHERLACQQPPPCHALRPFPPLSVRRSSGGQDEYVRQLWTCDGDSDKIAKCWENGHDRAACGADRLCARLDRRPIGTA